MRSDSGQKKAVVVAFAVLAVALAAFSIYRTVTASQGHSVGNLGDLSGERAAAMVGQGSGKPTQAASASGGGRQAEQQGFDAASGAPAEAATGESGNTGGSVR